MYVKRVFFDDLQEADNFEKQINSPCWKDVENLIDKMDGKNITQITMDNGEEDNYFCLGGGNEGLFNIFISENDNEIVSTLINPTDDKNIYKLVTGGQEADFEGRLCVNTQIAKNAAKYYYENGIKCDDYLWE